MSAAERILACSLLVLGALICLALVVEARSTLRMRELGYVEVCVRDGWRWQQVGKSGVLVRNYECRWVYP